MERKFKGEIRIDQSINYPITDIVINLLKLQEEGITHIKPIRGGNNTILLVGKIDKKNHLISVKNNG